MTKAELNLALSKTMEYLDKEPGSLEANNILIELKDQRVPFAIHADFYEFYSTEIMKAF